MSLKGGDTRIRISSRLAELLLWLTFSFRAPGPPSFALSIAVQANNPTWFSADALDVEQIPGAPDQHGGLGAGRTAQPFGDLGVFLGQGSVQAMLT